MLTSFKTLWKRGLARLAQRRAHQQHRRLIKSLVDRAHSLAGQEISREDSAGKSADFISIITPAYNTPRQYLVDLLQSIDRQHAGNFEIIIVDDGSTSKETIDFLRSITDERVRCLYSTRNSGIVGATNQGISEAKGNWITFLDHDDALSPYVIPLISALIKREPDCQFIYTDEIITNEALDPEDLFLKPAFDRVLLSGVNYINHLSFYRTERLRAIGGLRSGFDGSQDYDLVLRYTKDLPDSAIFHLPYPAYYWRRDGKSYSAQYLERATQAARRALSEVYDAAPVEGSFLIPTLHRVDIHKPRDDWPKVSVVIPNKNSRSLIAQAMDGLLRGTAYPDLEIIIVDNGSDDPDVIELYENYKKSSDNIIININEEPFNFSKMVNRGASLANSDLILLLNNDIEIIDPDWLKEMVSCLQFADAGVVGAKLLYPNRLSQHVGVMVGFGGYAGHWYLEQEAGFPGPMGRLAVRQSMSAVTGACFLTTRRCWEDLGGFDEQEFKIAYNDVDYCLRALSRGYRIIWTPFAVLVHHESATRGSDETPQNIARFEQEKASLNRRHGTQEFQDPAINPWYTTDRSYPVPRLLTAPPPARSGSWRPAPRNQATRSQ